MSNPRRPQDDLGPSVSRQEVGTATAKVEHQAIMAKVNICPIPVEGATILEHSRVFLCILQPKTQLYMVVDSIGINKKPLIVHREGTHILGGQSNTDILSNITIFYTANPYFEAQLSSFVAVFTKNTTVYGCRFYTYQ